MPNIKSTHAGNYYWLYDEECFSEIHQDLFKAKHWQELDAVNGQETGRGTTWFIQQGPHSLVLRHYLRGGMMAKLSKDRYLFRHLESCRSISEFKILNKLHQQGFPVPKPAAAQVFKSGIYYQADILIHRIPNAQDLVQILKQAQDNNFYIKLGKLIAHFHKAGVYHADLNIQNILQDDSGNFWLIDFDRAKLLPPKDTWQVNTLNRLKRSFEKELGRHHIKWQAKDWQTFLSAYKEENPLNAI